MADPQPQPTGVQISLLYHFCRLRLPTVQMPLGSFERHLQRAYNLARPKRIAASEDASWPAFLDRLHVIDWFLACACLEGQARAWECLFAARASRTDSLLVDALRGRAVRLFPRDESRQEQAVADFWGYLLAGESEGSTPILARYDGQRPLVPWLIRVFQNKHLSDLRPNHHQSQPLPDDPLQDPRLSPEPAGEDRWYEEFRAAAREWLTELGDMQLLILGLRLRYRMSQREVAGLLGIHEGNISRKTAELREQCLGRIGQRLQELGWTGDDLSGFILKEMDSLLLDEGRLSADRLAALLAARGKTVPATLSETARG
jgi:RNA polymerase sigma factor (sigma-70 family)